MSEQKSCNDDLAAATERIATLELLLTTEALRYYKMILELERALNNVQEVLLQTRTPEQADEVPL